MELQMLLSNAWAGGPSIALVQGKANAEHGNESIGRIEESLKFEYEEYIKLQLLSDVVAPISIWVNYLNHV